MWFTSDTHFGHNNIIKYCNRPFANTNDMNKQLIDNWNSVVQKDDEVYFLGDFAFLPKNEAQNIFNLLKGKKYLIIGNHDKVALKLSGWEWIKTGLDIKIEDYSIRLNHYPDENWYPYFENSYYLHGHAHGSRLPSRNQIDVGVDCWNYYPVSFEEIKDRAKVPLI